MKQEAGWYRHVHPAFRIICFVIFSLYLALGDLFQVGFAIAAIVVLYSMTGSGLLPGLWRMLRRMRWFLLSIVVIYAWFTPGIPLVETDEISAWLPTQNGLIDAAHRLLALICIIAAVHWLLFVTSRQQLVAALYWLAAGLKMFGLSRQRIAVRIALILDYVVEVQTLVGQQLKHNDVRKGDVRTYAAFASGLVETIVVEAEQSPCEQIEIDVDAAPDVRQWAWPLMLVLLMSLPFQEILN